MACANSSLVRCFFFVLVLVPRPSRRFYFQSQLVDRDGVAQSAFAVTMRLTTSVQVAQFRLVLQFQ